MEVVLEGPHQQSGALHTEDPPELLDGCALQPSNCLCPYKAGPLLGENIEGGQNIQATGDSRGCQQLREWEPSTGKAGRAGGGVAGGTGRDPDLSYVSWSLWMELGSDGFSVGEVPSMPVGGELGCEWMLGFDRCVCRLSD